MSAPSGKVGVAVVGHGRTASTLLEAARRIVPTEALADVVAVDAGEGETPDLGSLLCSVLGRVDRGHGVVVLVDLLGASPCQCARRQGYGHDLVVLSGLNLAMLLKLAGLDRTEMDMTAIAQACADSGRRAVRVTEHAALEPDEPPEISMVTRERTVEEEAP